MPDDDALSPEQAAAFNRGAREGLMKALNQLYVCCDKDRRACEQAYDKLLSMIEAEFPVPSDAAL